MIDTPLLTLAHTSIGRAAYAAGICPRALRAALANGSFTLLGEAKRVEPARWRWRRFEEWDVVRIAALGRLMRLGLTVPAAASILKQTLDDQLRDVTGCGPVLINGRLQNVALILAPLPGGSWHATTAPLGTSPGPYDTAITLNLGAIAADALVRLAAYRNPVRQGSRT